MEFLHAKISRLKNELNLISWITSLFSRGFDEKDSRDAEYHVTSIWRIRNKIASDTFSNYMIRLLNVAKMIFPLSIVYGSKQDEDESNPDCFN